VAYFQVSRNRYDEQAANAKDLHKPLQIWLGAIGSAKKKNTHTCIKLPFIGVPRSSAVSRKRLPRQGNAHLENEHSSAYCAP
jgi:hypothetical protein